MRSVSLARFGALVVAVSLAGCAEPQNPAQVLVPQFNVVSITSADLGTLGGNLSQAVAINHREQVVGFSTTAANETHAFLWQDGATVDLGTLGGTFSRPTAINDAGQVVGNSTLPSGSTCPNPAVRSSDSRRLISDDTPSTPVITSGLMTTAMPRANSV